MCCDDNNNVGFEDNNEINFIGCSREHCRLAREITREKIKEEMEILVRSTLGSSSWVIRRKGPGDWEAMAERR